MADTTVIKPPYAAFTTLKNFIEGFAATSVPSRIDKTTMKSLSGSSQTMVTLALRFFELIGKNDEPSQDFHDLVAAQGDAKKAIWKKLIEGHYKFIKDDSLDLMRATDGQLAEKFREFDLAGDTLKRCQTFFLNGCEAAGIPLGPHLKPSQTSGSSSASRSPARRKSPRKQSPPNDPPSPPASPSTKTVQELLLEKFPEFNPAWPEPIQKQWFDAYQKLLTGEKTP